MRRYGAGHRVPVVKGPLGSGHHIAPGRYKVQRNAAAKLEKLDCTFQQPNCIHGIELFERNSQVGPKVGGHPAGPVREL